MAPPQCSAASLEAGEALAGTAVDSVDRWLLLEVTGPWAPKPLQSDALPHAVRGKLERWLEGPRARLQLIRRPGRSGKRPVLMVVSSAAERQTASKIELGRYEDLLDVDLDALPAERCDPICLVCAHGRRDRCCGQLGSALFRALQSDGVEAWQTSHLGGHRFAACALWLPSGLMYGRLGPRDAPAFVAAQQAREIGELDHFRGRCAYDQPTQAAEIFLRRRSGERSIDALDWLGTSAAGDSGWEARFRTPSGEERIRVRRQETGAVRPASCGAKPEPVTGFMEA